MPYVCAVAECQNNRIAKRKRVDLAYHRFPTSNINLCKVWVTKCKRDHLNPKNARICSDHFQVEDYERDLRNELLGLQQVRRLKPDAIPSIFSTRSDNKGTNEICSGRISRSIRASEKSRKKLIEEITTAEAVQGETTPQTVAEEECSERNESRTDGSADTTREFQEALKHLSAENIALKKDLISTRKQLKKSLLQNKMLNRLYQTVQKQHSDCAVNTPKNLTKIFSKTQLQKLGGKKRVSWNTCDIVKALTVRSVSLKAYETASKIWNIPLPAVTTLRTWMKNFTCAPGILTDVIEVMKQNLVHVNSDSKICGFSFDEMGLDSRFIHDRTLDQVVSHSKAQVLMVRGLISKWKQPIYFDFDQNMIKEILFRCLLAFEGAGYLVYWITSDLGGENRGLWNSLDISTQKVSFENPFDPSRSIYVISDVPHDMKNLRNHLIDDGAILEDKTLLGLDLLEHMVSENGKEIKLCPKLSPILLYLKGSERMRVAPAVQLLSGHMATLAKNLYPSKPVISHFFDTVNNGFDVLNSRVPIDKTNSLKSGYGNDLGCQTNALKELLLLLEAMRFRTKKCKNEKKSLLPFQTGFIISIKSLMSLYEELSTKHGVKYILTSRLTQDCLESLFSVLRYFGGPHDNPTPPEFRYRMRLTLLGCRIRPPRGTNCIFDPENVSYVSGGLLEKNKLNSENGNEDQDTADVEVEGNENTEKLDELCSGNSKLDFATDEGLRYIAGYLAWKLKRLGLGNFGTPTGKATLTNSIPVDTNWIELISRGGLLIPNESILATVKSCDVTFGPLFEQFRKRRGISKLISKVIFKRNPSFNPIVVKHFVDTRLRIKLKYLNQVRAFSKNLKRKLKHFANGAPALKAAK